MSSREGIYLCLVGPAGSGKSSLGQKLREAFPKKLGRSISVTTRAPRTGEVQGQHYHFISRDEFEKRINSGDFFEHEETHGNLYGTLKATLESARLAGDDLLFDIDIRGALNLKKSYPLNTAIVFLVPPSPEEMISRMRKRGSIDDKELSTRLQTAAAEYQTLLKVAKDPGAVDYLLINDHFEQTLALLIGLLRTEQQKLHRLSSADLKKLCKVGAI